jgi:hypothetical protein
MGQSSYINPNPNSPCITHGAFSLLYYITQQAYTAYITLHTTVSYIVHCTVITIHYIIQQAPRLSHRCDIRQVPCGTPHLAKKAEDKKKKRCTHVVRTVPLYAQCVHLLCTQPGPAPTYFQGFQLILPIPMQLPSGISTVFYPVLRR